MVFRMIHSRKKEEAPKTAPPPVKTASKPRSSSSGAENKPAAEVPKVDFGFRRDFNKHYRLGRKLGQGSFGQAHVCLDLATNQQLAGKVILKKNLGTQESIDDVIREAKILQTLGQKGAHPNFIDFYGVFEDDKMVIFVLEFCTGGELLERILMKKQHSEKDARDIVRQILGVVANCHLNGVIHRDIKAQNFLFANTSANSPVKIIDFGLSDFFEPDTVFRKPVGTMLYAAPEVLQKKYGPLADLWSVGVLSFILLTGEPPFWDKTEAATRHKILHSQVQLIGGVWDRVSADCKDFISRLLDRNNSTRMSASGALSHRWMQQDTAADVPLDYQVLNSIRHFAGQNKVRQMFMYRVAETFLDDEIRHLRDQFFAMDKDNDGCISIQEMADALRAMRTGETSQQIIPEEQIEEILEGIDVDGNGLIDYMEFIAATLQLSRFHQGNSTEWDNRTLQLFENIDKDGNGYLDPLELAHALGYGDDVQDVLAEADLNLDGVIDYDEFRTLMRKVAGIAPASASS